MNKIQAIILTAVLSSGCVMEVAPEEQLSENVSGSKPPVLGGEQPDYSSSPCDSQYVEGLNGEQLEIPVECQLIVVDPYSEHRELYDEHDDFAQMEEELVEIHEQR